MELFNARAVLVANPQLYDYVHDLEFAPEGTVRMSDGAGQVLNSRILGRYRVTHAGADAAQVDFYELCSVNPYDESQEIERLEDFSVRLTRESGTFPFREQVVWNVSDEDEWPCLLYHVRYAFDNDPLATAREVRQNNRNLYYALADADATLAPHERFYYATTDRHNISARELIASGVAKELFW